MNVTANTDSDVFDQRYNEWPLGSDDHWNTLFAFTESLAANKNMPSLWTPLLSASDRHAGPMRQLPRHKSLHARLRSTLL